MKDFWFLKNKNFLYHESVCDSIFIKIESYTLFKIKQSWCLCFFFLSLGVCVFIPLFLLSLYPFLSICPEFSNFER